ncbi:MAG: S8 family serine peptidase, partial [Acidimicrobiales bacterium]
MAAVNGTATFAGLGIDSAGTGYQLRATSGSLTAATSTGFAINHGAANRLAFGQQPPTSATAGQTLMPAVTVKVLDAVGNLVANATDQVTLAIASGSGTAGAALSGGGAVAAVNGIATFPTLSIDSVGTGYQLRATSGILTVATSNALNITAGAAARLAFGQQPTSTTAGASITPAVTVKILDAVGNLVLVNSSVTVAILSGTGTPGALLDGNLTVSASGGIATFASLSIDSVGTGYRLRATSGSLSTATSTTFAIGHGTAARLAFGQQPIGTTAGTTITPAVTVKVLDLQGNLVADATNSVTVALGSNPGGDGVLDGTPTTVAAVAGFATFSNLDIDEADTYTLTAAASGLTGATSNAFTITAGALSQLAFTAQPPNGIAGVVLAPA